MYTYYNYLSIYLSINTYLYLSIYRTVKKSIPQENSTNETNSNTNTGNNNNNNNDEIQLLNGTGRFTSSG